MRDPESLEKLLADQHEHGLLDSVGTFTLDVANARLKLGQFQLGPGLYLAKLIQAGVLARCSRIEVWLDGRLKIRYSNPDLASLSIQLLARGLEEPLSLDAASPAACVCAGLLSGHAGRRDLTWSDSSGTRLRIVDRKVEVQPAEPDLAGSKPEATLTIQNLGDCAVEHHVMESRCGYCAVPIWLNGSRLPCRWERELSDTWGIQMRLAERYWGGAIEGVHLPQTDPPQAVAPALYCFPASGVPPWDCAIAIPAKLVGPTVIHWIRFGVQVQTESLPEPGCGAIIVASAENLRSDFSQLELAVDSEFRARRGVLLNRLNTMLAGLLVHREQLNVPRQAGLVAEASCIGMGGVSSSLIGLLLPNFLAPIWVVGSCAVGLLGPLIYFWLASRTQDKAARHSIVQRLRQLVNDSSLAPERLAGGPMHNLSCSLNSSEEGSDSGDLKG